MQDVVVSREDHQHQHKRQPHPGNPAPASAPTTAFPAPLRRLEQKVPAIEKRDRKQVEKADRDRKDRGEVNQRRETDGGDLTGDLGDSNRPPDLIRILPAGEDSADIGNGAVNNEPCLLDAQPNSGRWIHWFGDGVAGTVARVIPRMPTR